jgi:peptidoglycan/LPS O-acetylase OafA/YrhL
MNLLLVLPLAWASYNLIEKPFLGLRVRFQRRLDQRAARTDEIARGAAAARDAA